MADLPEPPSTPTPGPPAALPPPPSARPGSGGPASSLTLGPRPLVLAVGVVLLATLFVAGVLGYRDHRNDGDQQVAAAPSTTPTSTAPAATTCREANGIPAASGKPTDIPVPPKPVTALQTRDIKQGTGKAAANGDQLSVQYVGVSCSTGKQFDSSWDRNAPLPVTLGQGGVIPGWDEGLVGMKVGGRRLLWIPPSLAYGATGQPPAIGPNETLIFVIDLVKIG